MECQSRFSEKDKTYIIDLLFAEFAQRVVKVNSIIIKMQVLGSRRHI